MRHMNVARYNLKYTLFKMIGYSKMFTYLRYKLISCLRYTQMHLTFHIIIRYSLNINIQSIHYFCAESNVTRYAILGYVTG
jgi:hypothetical protein